MNDEIRRIYEAARRTLVFIDANLAAFAAVPIVAETNAELSDAADALENLGADKATKTGAALDKTLSRGDARRRLLDQIRDIADVWKRIAPKTGGDVNKFRKPRGGDTDIIAVAESFADQLATVAVEFTKRGFPADFIENLKSSTEDFAALVGESEQARAARAGTNAAFDAPARTCREAIADLDPIVKMVFADNPQKLAEWLVASHIERAPKSGGVRNPPNAPTPHQ